VRTKRTLPKNKKSGPEKLEIGEYVCSVRKKNCHEILEIVVYVCCVNKKELPRKTYNKGCIRC